MFWILEFYNDFECFALEQTLTVTRTHHMQDQGKFFICDFVKNQWHPF